MNHPANMSFEELANIISSFFTYHSGNKCKKVTLIVDELPDNIKYSFPINPTSFFQSPEEYVPQTTAQIKLGPISYKAVGPNLNARGVQVQAFDENAFQHMVEFFSNTIHMDYKNE